MKYFFLTIFCTLFFATNAQVQKVYFTNDSFVHLHEFKSEDASYTQTLACGTPVKLVERKEAWSRVIFLKSEGFVSTSSLSLTPPTCFHEKYPVFYESLKLDSADLYYWGKLGGKL